QFGERLTEQQFGVGVAAPLPDVGQMRLIGRDGRGRRRRVVLVASGRLAAVRAVPEVRYRRLDGETERAAVATGAEVVDLDPLVRQTPIAVAPGAAADPRSAMQTA